MVGVLCAAVLLGCCLGLTAAADDDFKKVCSALGDFASCTGKGLVDLPRNTPPWIVGLSLNNNSIRSLESSGWKNLTKIQELKLNKNKIREFQHGTFDKMKHLKILELNRNQLETIKPLGFKPLGEVSSLKLRRNKIHNLPDGSFYGLASIKSLQLDFNLIQVVRKAWLYSLDKLKELSLSHNLVHTIDTDAWEFCRELIKLDLSHNSLKSIMRDTLKDLTNLQELILDSNNISIIDELAFSHVPNLKILNLSNNKISWAIEDSVSIFRSLINLEKFHIASNNIQSINRIVFNGLHKVNFLNLNKNNIVSIQRQAFSEMPMLTELLLTTNSLLCDCNIKWFYDFLHMKRFNVKTVCAYPDWLRGSPLLNVSENNFTCNDVPKPRLIEEPGVEIMALKGENINLKCKAVSSSPSPMIFQWKKDNVFLQNINTTPIVTTDGRNTESTSYLNITGVKHSDAGKYQCAVANDFGTTYSQKTTISVLIYPTFNKMPSNITVQTGMTARLDCSAAGEPQPEIAWQKDGGNDFPAARERRMQVMPADDVFFIVNAKPSDTGVYSCIARNPAGIIVANATLMIEERPSFVKPMEDKEVTAGEPVVIQCMASGAPKPTIQWLKDDVPIAATERHFFTAEEQLMIIVDTILSDTGTYTCKLNNSLGSELGSSMLYVKPVLTSHDTLGIIIIAVFSCAVITSGVWVVIIYQTRRRNLGSTVQQPQPEPIMLEFMDNIITQYGDNASEHSSCKDSGTGDSAKRSNDDLVPPDEYTLIINENGSGGSSSVVSAEKKAAGRAASLVYLPHEANNSQAPLLYIDSQPYTRSTNHDRLSGEDEEEAAVSAADVIADVASTK